MGALTKRNESQSKPNEGNSDSEHDSHNGLCDCFHFSGVNEAKGYAMLGVVRGAIIMSGIFLSTSLIYLANIEAGCGASESSGSEENNCDNKVYGFRPSSLIPNIAVISGILSALLMPVTGAIVDCTHYRRLVGIVSAMVIIIIQGLQIGTVQSTWLAIAILQAIGGFVYQVQVLSTYSYLPEIGRIVGEEEMTSFMATFVMLQFFAQAAFLVLIVGISMGFGLNEVVTAQVSQSINTTLIIVGFVIGWMLLPSVPAMHQLESGKFLLCAGFTQIWKTMKGINKHYANGLRWFLVSCVFASAGSNAFTTVSVAFMSELLGMNGTEVGIVFLIALISSLPGSKIGAKVSIKKDPVTSLKVLLVLFSGITVAGAVVLDGPERKNVCYGFGVLWGLCLGWFYPISGVIFSLSLPKGQETELTGFFIYSTQILVWLPPLIFSSMNEAGISMRWGLISLITFFIIALAFLQLMVPWSEVRQNALTNKMILFNERSDNSTPQEIF